MKSGLSKRSIVNILLLITLSLLVYFILYQPQKIFKPTNPSLFSTSFYEAENIIIQSANNPIIEIKKMDQHWQLIRPAYAAIDQDKIKLLLTIMQEPIVATYPVEGSDLASFGLDKPKRYITINGERLALGKTNPLTLNRYLLKDNKIYTMNEIVYGILGAGLPLLLSHQLIAEGEEITAVNAPEALQAIDRSTWQQLVANNIADHTVDSEGLGELTLTTKQGVYAYTVLAIAPELILYRKDLGISYRIAQPKKLTTFLSQQHQP